jgi:hypothetical protein
MFDFIMICTYYTRYVYMSTLWIRRPYVWTAARVYGTYVLQLFTHPLQCKTYLCEFSSYSWKAELCLILGENIE